MNGLIVVNKEKGYTSRDVVNVLGKTLGTKKIGHTGTLDPIAEGVLVCVVGKCTKLCDVLISDEKEYVATMKFGVLTDTLDDTGNILKTKDKTITLEEVNNALNYFAKEYLQEVPIYSAVKVDGKKLYDYARSGLDVDLPKRMVNIKSIELIEFKDNVLTFKTKVSKGTFIRSLIRDIGEYLGTYGTMTKLVRTNQSGYKIEQSYTLDEIKSGNYQLIELDEIFKDYPSVEVDDKMYEKIIHGQEFNNNIDKEYIVYKYKSEVIAIYQISKKDKNKIKPLIII